MLSDFGGKWGFSSRFLPHFPPFTQKKWSGRRPAWKAAAGERPAFFALKLGYSNEKSDPSRESWRMFPERGAAAGPRREDPGNRGAAHPAGAKDLSYPPTDVKDSRGKSRRESGETVPDRRRPVSEKNLK
jgi:hypothetical protein